jgi:hypothetical protein
MPQEPVAGQEGYAFERSGLFEEVGCPGHDLEPGFPAMEKRAAGRIEGIAGGDPAPSRSMLSRPVPDPPVDEH